MSLDLTQKEKEFIISFGQSDYYDGSDSKLWDFSVHDYLPYSGKTRSGVVSSLVQKGIINKIDKKQYGSDNKFHVYEICEAYQNNVEILKLLGDE